MGTKVGAAYFGFSGTVGGYQPWGASEFCWGYFHHCRDLILTKAGTGLRSFDVFCCLSGHGYGLVLAGTWILAKYGVVASH